jgi:ubiquinone/menaquinone biosynthesis C-methylase UbiE
MLSKKDFDGYTGTILIQDQARARNLDSKKHSSGFDDFKFQFHSFVLDTFSTASTHSGREGDGGKDICLGTIRTAQGFRANGAPMVEAKAAFNDGAAYERFMGRWSRAVGGVFLEWLAPPKGAHWLDVGCGTGAFTELVLRACSPAKVTGIDSFPEQIEYAHSLPVARLAEFKTADALNLPFDDCSFDVVASALVINFIPDRPRGLAEMRRVAKPGGLVAGYVWDFAGGRATGAPLAKGMRAIGVEPPITPGTNDTTMDALQALFTGAGLQAVELRQIEIEPAYSSFEDFWTSQTGSVSPTAKFIGSLNESERLRLRDAVRSILPSNSDGSVSYSACAHAIKARAPE